MTSVVIACQYIILMLSMSGAWQDSFKWAATGCMMISALAVSFSVELASEAFTFSGFLIGHIIWAVSAVSMKERALVVINIGLIPIDFYAMYIRL